MSGNAGSPSLTGPATPDTPDNQSTTPPATYSPGYRTLVNPYAVANQLESGAGIPTTGPQPDNATPTNPWPVSEELVNAILSEVQTRYRLLASNNLRPSLTVDEIGVALYDAIDTLNNYPPATQFTIDQLFAVNADPRFRGVFYVCVAQKLLNTLVWDWTANGFSQKFNNFSIENKLEDYQKLLAVMTEQIEAQLKNLKAGTQKFLKRVVPYNQSMIRTVGIPYRRPLGGYYSGGGGWGNGC